MSLIIEHEFIIAAKQQVLWDVLTDFSCYKNWNPFVVDCECELAVGNEIIMQVIMGKGNPRHQVEYISEVEQGTYFSYTSPKSPTFLLRSFRSHTLQTLDNGKTRYQSRFELHGWLIPILSRLLGSSLQKGFSEMGLAVSAEAERIAQL
tara:strand:- start:2881 stop:3327 length:447 start_codon:yes stop_codon:yes gene_type:complete